MRLWRCTSLQYTTRSVALDNELPEVVIIAVYVHRKCQLHHQLRAQVRVGGESLVQSTQTTQASCSELDHTPQNQISQTI